MKPQAAAGWGPILTAFTIWFAHFLLCWAASEIWPQGRTAHALAWALTALALLALGLHLLRVNATTPGGELTAWSRRFAQGAVAIATAAVVFVALPSLMLLR